MTTYRAALTLGVVLAVAAPSLAFAHLPTPLQQDVRGQTGDLGGPVLLAPRADSPSKGALDEVAMAIGTMGKAIIARRQALVANLGETEADMAVRLCTDLSLGGIVIVESSTGAAEVTPPRLTVHRCAPARQDGASTGIRAAAAAAQTETWFRAGTGAVRGTIGLATPLGEVGIEGDYSFDPSFALSAGVGWGWYGPQASVMPRYRRVLGRAFALTVGAGASFGRYGWFENWLPDSCKASCASKTGNIAWGNGELGLELRIKRFSLRQYVGLGIPLNPDSLQCDHSLGEASYKRCTNSYADEGKGALPYAGTAVGVSFDLSD